MAKLREEINRIKPSERKYYAPFRGLKSFFPLKTICYSALILVSFSFKASSLVSLYVLTIFSFCPLTFAYEFNYRYLKK